MRAFNLTLLSVVTAISLSACASAPTLPKIMAENSWKGADAQSAVAKFGQPANITTDAKGRQVYNWYDNWGRNIDVPLGSFVERGTVYLPYETRRQNFNCHVSAAIENGRIAEMKFDYNRIGGCEAFGI